jgi:hypothetical protein
VTVPGGTFQQSIVLQQTSRISSTVEQTTFAPDVGIVEVQSPNDHLRLLASTLIQPASLQPATGPVLIAPDGLSFLEAPAQ